MIREKKRTLPGCGSHQSPTHLSAHTRGSRRAHRTGPTARSQHGSALGGLHARRERLLGPGSEVGYVLGLRATTGPLGLDPGAPQPAQRSGLHPRGPSWSSRPACPPCGIHLGTKWGGLTSVTSLGLQGERAGGPHSAQPAPGRQGCGPPRGLGGHSEQAERSPTPTEQARRPHAHVSPGDPPSRGASRAASPTDAAQASAHRVPAPRLPLAQGQRLWWVCLPGPRAPVDPGLCPAPMPSRVRTAALTGPGGSERHTCLPAPPGQRPDCTPSSQSSRPARARGTVPTWPCR